ncbi:hypothetical protein LTR95_016597 [Oleoguttula sp. CCFEE 5521]
MVSPQHPSGDGRSLSSSPIDLGLPGGPTTHRPHKVIDLFDVLVGTAPYQSYFELHTFLFYDRSVYFRRHLDAGTNPAIPNTTPTVFGAYLTLAYAQSVTAALRSLAANDDAPALRLIDTYNLAYHLGDYTVCNKIIDWMISSLYADHSQPSVEDSVHVYSTDPSDEHPLRLLVTMWFMLEINDDWDPMEWEALPKQLLADCMRAYVRRKNANGEHHALVENVFRRGPGTWKRCGPLHLHSDEHPKCKTREEMLEDLRRWRGI